MRARGPGITDPVSPRGVTRRVAHGEQDRLVEIDPHIVELLENEQTSLDCFADHEIASGNVYDGGTPDCSEVDILVKGLRLEETFELKWNRSRSQFSVRPGRRNSRRHKEIDEVLVFSKHLRIRNGLPEFGSILYGLKQGISKRYLPGLNGVLPVFDQQL